MATLLEKAKLLRGYLGGDVAYAGPFWVIAVITRRCNLRCVGCRFHSPLLEEPEQADRAGTKDMPLSLFEGLCQELRTMETKSITITGEGEPFLHPSLPDIVCAAKRGGLRVTLITNGTRLERNVIEHLVDARLDTLKVSLWAGTAELYEKVYPGNDPACFTEIVKGLKLVAGIKAEKGSGFPSVVVHHPLNRTNYQAMDAIVDVAHETGVDALSLSPWRTFRGKFDSLALTADDEKALRASLPQMERKLRSLSIRHNTKELLQRYDLGNAAWKKLPCYIGWLHARVLVDGTVLACHRSNLAMGNLHEESLREIWNGPAYRAFRRKAARLQGLASLSEECDCSFCGFTMDNVGVHRYFRWLSPFVPKFED